MLSLAAVVVLKLPPGEHVKVFEKLDFLTFALMALTAAMIVAVLAQGYTHWWFDTPWLAYMLVAAVVLLSVALCIEHHRPNLLVQTRRLVFQLVMLDIWPLAAASQLPAEAHLLPYLSSHLHSFYLNSVAESVLWNRKPFVETMYLKPC